MHKCIFKIYLTNDHTKPVETQDLLYLFKLINHIVQHIARAAWYIPASDVIQILAHQRTGPLDPDWSEESHKYHAERHKQGPSGHLYDSLSMARKVEVWIPILTSRESYNATKVFISYIKLIKGNPKILPLINMQHLLVPKFLQSLIYLRDKAIF